MAYLFGERYIQSPVSPLYALSHQQDIAFPKPRASIHQRNHLRPWLTPLRFEGQEAWVGRISRDIGVKFTTKSKTGVTQVIDPDVDEARNAFIQDLLFSQGLVKTGCVKGGKSKKKAAHERGFRYATFGLQAA